MLIHLLYTVLLFSSSLAYEQVCNHQDQSSLLAVSTNISTSSSSPPLNWSSSISCCYWEGVDCDASGRVTHLQLLSRGLQGTITSSIGNLVKLTHLNLSNNYLHGKLLGEGIVGLANLKVLDLSSNSIHGSIPREIGKLISLQKLHLNDNKLHGLIPSSLMNCSKLEEIILRINLLKGDLSKLDFSRLFNLQKLDLANNALEGAIPESVYSCKSLIAFRVTGNNDISGQISPRIVGLKSLSFLSLAENSLTNITSALRVLAECKNLTFLLVSASFYGEILPVHTAFIGLNGFPKLQVFAVANNDFGGPIPEWISNLKRLRHLDLHGNKMTGKVPDWLGALPNLFSLHLSDNNLSGEVPLQLFLLPSLISRDANLNYLHCDLPLQVGRGRTVFWTSQAFYITTNLDLSNNRFSGNIPLEIGNLQGLQLLDLNSNNFSGHIPVSISNLKYLELLNLSGNSLTGEIPTSLQSLSFLAVFNVSYNKLKGPIPVGGQFETFGESTFIGNPGLCGEQINRSCSNKAPSFNTNNNVIDRVHVRRDHKKQDFVNGLIIGCAFGFTSVLAIVASYVWFNGSRP